MNCNGATNIIKICGSIGLVLCRKSRRASGPLVWLGLDAADHNYTYIASAGVACMNQGVRGIHNWLMNSKSNVLVQSTYIFIRWPTCHNQDKYW